MISSQSFFQQSKSKLELFPLEELAKDINETNPPALSTGGFAGITLARNVKSEREVDEIITLAKSQGAKIANQPQKVFWGDYSAYFQVLDGYD